MVLFFAQILLESLPISSSGHLAIIQQLTGLPPLSNQVMYALHAPTAFILALYWRKQWWPIVTHPYRFRHIIAKIVAVGFCAELATVICYAAIKYLNPSDQWLPVGFAITGVLLLMQAPRLQYFNLWATCPRPGRALPCTRGTLNKGPGTASLARAGAQLAAASFIGLLQGLAAFPGLSRLGVTYVGGVWLGMRPLRSFAFSCMIQWPLIAGAAAQGLWSVRDVVSDACDGWFWGVLAVASVLAYGALYCFEWLIVTGRVWILGVYLLLLTLAWSVVTGCAGSSCSLL